MRVLRKSKRNRVVDSLFSGKTYRTISDAEGVSMGKISGIYKEFVGEAEEYSINEASEEYNVVEKIDSLQELAKERKKLKVSLPSLLAAARLTRLMRARGLEVSQLEDYMKMCDKHRESFSDFASKATELFRMEERTGKSYEEMAEEYPVLVKKNTELERKVKETSTELRRETKKLKKERQQAQENLNHELKSNNLLREEIPFASALKKTLLRHSFAIEDTNEILGFLREIDACGGDVKVFFEMVEKKESLELQIRRLEDIVGWLAPVVETKTKDVNKLERRRDELRDENKSLEIKKGKLQSEVKRLDEQADEKRNDLRLADCLTSVLLSKPADLDPLYKHVKMLWEIACGKWSGPAQYKATYKKEVRRLIANTLLEYLKEELATRQEVTELQEKLNETETQNSGLSDKVEKLEEENRVLRTEKTKFERKAEGLEKELQECTDQLLRDPSIKPKDTKLPF